MTQLALFPDPNQPAPLRWWLEDPDGSCFLQARGCAPLGRVLAPTQWRPHWVVHIPTGPGRDSAHPTFDRFRARTFPSRENARAWLERETEEVAREHDRARCACG